MIKGVMQGVKLRIRTPYKDQAELEYKNEIGKWIDYDRLRIMD